MDFIKPVYMSYIDIDKFDVNFEQELACILLSIETVSTKLDIADLTSHVVSNLKNIDFTDNENYDKYIECIKSYDDFCVVYDKMNKLMPYKIVKLYEIMANNDVKMLMYKLFVLNENPKNVYPDFIRKIFAVNK
jgi:hypothetical protein